MYFLVYAEDKPDSLSVRQHHRNAHLEWLRSDPNVLVRTAGPWLDSAGDMRGSLLIVESDMQSTVEAWLAKDPYKAGGLTESVTLKPYNWVIGAP